MKHRVLTVAITLGLAAGASEALAQSAALQKAQEAADQFDISQYLTARTDARSQSFGFGGTHTHEFTVEKSGRYVFTSSTLAGESDDYRIKAALLDNKNRVIARGEGLGQNGGLRLEQQLEPGDYVLRVSADKFGSEASGGNSFIVSVAGLNAQGKRLSSDESGIDTGSGIHFGSAEGEQKTAFVDNKDAVATIAVPAAAASASGQSTTDAKTSSARTSDETSSAGSKTRPKAFEEIVADIRIRQEGEVLTFDVAQAGTISVTSSTFPGTGGSYTLQARILDEDGRVVASDKGAGEQGDFSIETPLQPGRYRVWVSGRKFGTAMEGANRYTLRVRQLDTRP
ncbi:hypothetical protein [Modicisalibacter sp. 'Wilcox']|uniref:hypothetical protein n=1 Tax=Modicisalibacter sp. 'Wilcox' TaxID=2679914 RepID=UPI0013D54238|nr:hypothetical protein [Modicisalibacter sp. 'Wilcox']